MEQIAVHTYLTGCRLAQEWSRSSCVIGGGCGGSKGTCKSTDERISVSRLPVIVSTLSEILNFLVADKWELQWGPIFKNSKTSFFSPQKSLKEIYKHKMMSSMYT
jgi:hypothetical protein